MGKAPMRVGSILIFSVIPENNTLLFIKVKYYLEEMHKNENRQFIKRLSKIGIVIPGHIHKKYLSCGRDYCSCMKSKKDQHGPYYFWQYKKDEKVTSKSIPQEKLKEFYRWFKNRKLLEAIINEALDRGVAYVCGILKKNNENKSKKTNLSKRGM